MARILFLQLQQFSFPGLYYICGALREAGHAYEVFASNRQEEIAERVRRFRPDLVGFPAMTGIHGEILATAAELKKTFPGLGVVLGGVHPTLYPEVLEEDSVDYICRGEGERPTVELLDSIDAGSQPTEVRNISYKLNGKIRHNPMRPLSDPLDDLPFPDYSIYRNVPIIANDTYPAVFMTRGCPFSCTYCHNSKQRKLYRGLGRYVRSFGIERILSEVEAALRFYPMARAVLLGTDTLGTNVDWLEELLNRYHSRFEVPYTCLIRPEFINERLVRILRETECHMLAFGIESGSERVRKEVLQRRYSNDQVLRAAALLKEHGIRFRTYNIVGFPTETRQEMLSTLDINLQIRPDFPWCSIFTPYPETALADLCIDEGYLDPTFTYDDIPLSFFNDTLLRGVDRDFILNLHSFFQAAVLWPRLLPLVRRLVAGPHRRAYRMVFKAVYSYVCLKSERRSLFSYLRLAYANRRFFK